MYKPPQNSNRVKSIKSKFENNIAVNPSSGLSSGDLKTVSSSNGTAKGAAAIVRRSYLANGNYSNIKNNLEQMRNGNAIKPGPNLAVAKQTSPNPHNYARIAPTSNNSNSNNSKQILTKKPVLPNLNVVVKELKQKADNSNSKPANRPPLNRQLSDPIKRNIKRTPAFRVDSNKSPDLVTKTANNGNSDTFSRKNAFYQSTFESKVKQFSALKNCDNSSHGNDNKNVTTICLNGKPTVNSKPVLLKSKSSIDFAYLRSRFDNNKQNKDCNSSTNSDSRVMNDKDEVDAPARSNGNSQRQENSRSVSVIRIVNDDKHVQCVNVNGNIDHIYQNGSFSPPNDKTALINNINKIYQKVENLYQKESPPKIDLSMLYTEPIPKSQRIKIQDFYNAATLKLNEKIASDPDLTDTLKSALKRPLPPGPAPKKPPRTFQHPPLPNPNKSFLYLEKCHAPPQNAKTKKEIKPKNDPKYMLSKLENALKNNKLRSRNSKQKKALAEVKRLDLSTTSGEEDSDDSLLFRSKTLPKLPSANYLSNSPNGKLGSFNCLQMNCGVGGANAYERIPESKSSFFVKEEPVYDEPINLRTGNKNKLERNLKKNSLYYMSSPIMGNNSGGGEKVEELTDCIETKFDNEKKPHDLNLLSNTFKSQVMISAENSSLSSFTSDLESTPSPMEESCSKMKYLIDTFEAQNNRSEDGCDRIENLKSHLQKTLNNSFGCHNDCDDENLCVADMIMKFETYRKNVPKYCQPKLVHKDTLFYCCLVIEKVKNITRIKFKFPSCAQIPPNIELLCFPEGENMHLDSTNNCYSLSLTNEQGERTYGYCKRVLPEGSSTCLPLTYCILSKYKAPRFYKKMLDELESRHGIRNRCRDELITAFYNQKFPKPGESIRINLKSITGSKSDEGEKKGKSQEDLDLTSHIQVTSGQYGTINRLKNKKSEEVQVNSCGESDKELILTLHQDALYEDADLIRLHRLPVDVLQKLFSCLLLERKVVLISHVISDLSTCVESLQSLLYPFIWCHTFIPILPDDLWDIVESPTPLICGVLCDKVVEYHKVENGMVVNIDTGEILVEEGDENKIMSGSMVKTWRKSLTYASREINGNNYVYNVLLRQAYLQVFRLCFHNVHHFIVDGVFQKADFLKNAKSKGLRNFLRMFVETNMFMAFQDSILSLDSAAVDELFKANKVDNYNKTSDKLFHWK